MKNLISNFAAQLATATEIAGHTVLTASPEEIRNVVICGMGGSGIGGNIAAELAAPGSPVPITVVKDYFLPGFVNENTLFIASSYSGDTEETIHALEEATRKNAHIVCITSGGQVRAIAERSGLDLFLIPSGLPPRAALGYSLTQLLCALEFHRIIPGSYQKQINGAILLLSQEENNIIRSAKESALVLKDRIAVIYGTAGMESVALRFRQQINENSKALCWHHVFPELNHNEIQGWRIENEQLAVVIFRNGNDYIRTAKRIDVTAGILEHYSTPIIEIFSKGDSPLARTLYLIHWGDWVSYFIAEFKGLDTMDISVIRYLKSELAKL
ncbi:MAG TPA: bifunctional phosphoglucose/phosphomannose isomerase [Bacteroidia bacterium]|nr:bifunctional phosphoglucose/phosphomannose isomerase [Bacteroidia bacterium]